MGALERLLQSLTGERVDPGVGRRRQRVVAAARRFSTSIEPMRPVPPLTMTFIRSSFD
jgi:hypothetical protein